MTEQSPPAVMPVDVREPFPVRIADVDRSAKIRLFSRIGLWSVVVGMIPVAADILSSTWNWGIDPGSFLPDLSLVIGGIGTSIASGLTLREVGRGPRPVQLAAIAGVPLGLTLVMLGSMLLTEPWFPPTPFLQTLFSVGVRGAVFLAVVVIVLLLVAFVAASSGAEEQLEQGQVPSA